MTLTYLCCSVFWLELRCRVFSLSELLRARRRGCRGVDHFDNVYICVCVYMFYIHTHIICIYIYTHVYVYISNIHIQTYTRCAFSAGLRAAAWQVAYGLLRGKWPAGCCVASGLRAAAWQVAYGLLRGKWPAGNHYHKHNHKQQPE